MNDCHALSLPAAPAGSGLSGCWTLARESAVTLAPREAGFLRVAHGTIWATLDGPHAQGVANTWGDQVLRCGTRIHLTPGQHVVLEPYAVAANEDARSIWERDTQPARQPASRAVATRRWLRARLAGWLGGVAHWMEPGPGWPGHPQRAYARARDQAWRTLYHLGINQP